MLKSRYFLLIILLVIFGSFVFLESISKKPIDWASSYWKTHKKPFGAEVFQNIYTENLDQCEESDGIVYEIFNDEKDYSGNFLFFNETLYFGEYDTKELLCWVENGNTLFLSAEYLPEALLDTLGLNKSTFVFDDQLNYQPSFQLNSNENLIYHFERNHKVNYFTNTDTLDIEVLGNVSVSNQDQTEQEKLPNFIKSDFGNGEIYLHLFPKVFTNYFLLKNNNAEYTEQILNNLDYGRTVYVDTHYKAQKEQKQAGILQYLVGNKHLRWAYYIILLTGLIYIFFEGKRKQKPIKVLRPFQNKTYEFTKTISSMYFSKNDHKSIATKQIEHFFDYVRDKFNIPTSTLNDKFVNNLAVKSGNEEKTIINLLKLIDGIEKKPTITKEDLIKLDKLISNLKT